MVVVTNTQNKICLLAGYVKHVGPTCINFYKVGTQ